MVWSWVFHDASSVQSLIKGIGWCLLAAPESIEVNRGSKVFSCLSMLAPRAAKIPDFVNNTRIVY